MSRQMFNCIHKFFHKFNISISSFFQSIDLFKLSHKQINLVELTLICFKRNLIKLNKKFQRVPFGVTRCSDIHQQNLKFYKLVVLRLLFLPNAIEICCLYFHIESHILYYAITVTSYLYYDYHYSLD